MRLREARRRSRAGSGRRDGATGVWDRIRIKDEGTAAMENRIKDEAAATPLPATSRPRRPRPRRHRTPPLPAHLFGVMATDRDGVSIRRRAHPGRRPPSCQQRRRCRSACPKRRPRVGLLSPTPEAMESSAVQWGVAMTPFSALDERSQPPHHRRRRGSRLMM
jgi:hypothetical protein